jgi:hypothetical protein
MKTDGTVSNFCGGLEVSAAQLPITIFHSMINGSLSTGEDQTILLSEEKESF